MSDALRGALLGGLAAMEEEHADDLVGMLEDLQR
jgi:hypothetical protein